MQIAPVASCYDVLPSMRTMLAPWNHMIKGQVMDFFATVLARELVPQKNFFLG